jgi:4a-hydroxytetrahydrobiopterin dehydratase
MSELASRDCVPCKGGTPPLKGEELENLKVEVPEWNVVDEHHLTRKFEFENFAEALDFVNEVGRIAEEQGHHPDINFGWGQAQITVFTHKIDGLTESDFVFAAKVDRL